MVFFRDGIGTNRQAQKCSYWFGKTHVPASRLFRPGGRNNDYVGIASTRGEVRATTRAAAARIAVWKAVYLVWATGLPRHLFEIQRAQAQGSPVRIKVSYSSLFLLNKDRFIDRWSTKNHSCVKSKAKSQRLSLSDAISRGQSAAGSRGIVQNTRAVRTRKKSITTPTTLATGISNRAAISYKSFSSRCPRKVSLFNFFTILNQMTPSFSLLLY